MWRSGQLEVSIVNLRGDVETSGAALDAPADLLVLFEAFIRWEPIPPKTPKELAAVSARLCKLLRDEVAEQLALGSPALTALATDWRKLLFPEASNATFADGYAQAVTFGLLIARARDITLSSGLDQVGKQLGRSNSLIGAALRLLTDDVENQKALQTSLDTLTRVLDAVNWHTISKDRPAKAKLFGQAVELGRVVIWLHTFGERCADAKAGRPAGPPRLPKEYAPRIPREGAIPSEPERMPDDLEYDAGKQRLHVGLGFIDNVAPAVWEYEVSGKKVLAQWFSYRKKNRERPIIGDRRPPSKLGDIQPDGWLAEYTAELLNVLHVLGRLVEIEPLQAKLLEQICSGSTISCAELSAAGALAVPQTWKKKLGASSSLFDDSGADEE